MQIDENSNYITDNLLKKYYNLLHVSTYQNPRVMSLLENRLTGLCSGKDVAGLGTYESKKSIVTRGEH